MQGTVCMQTGFQTMPGNRQKVVWLIGDVAFLLIEPGHRSKPAHPCSSFMPFEFGLCSHALELSHLSLQDKEKIKPVIGQKQSK